MAQRLARAVLLLSSAVFAGFGIVFTIFTARMARVVEIDLATDVARTDLAATYGGFELGFAAFLFVCWRTAAWARPGLLAAGCALAGFAVVRLAGMIQSAELSPLMLTVLIAETAGSAASFWGARQIGNGLTDGR